MRYGVLTLLFITLVLTVSSVEAHYPGIEPERLTSLLDTSGLSDSSDERLADLERTLSASSNAALYYEKGRIHAIRNEWEKAEEAFGHASRMAEARLGRAISLIRLGKANEAWDLIKDDSGKISEYALAIIRLHGDEGVNFSDLRKSLQPSLNDIESEPEIFEFWLGLNPEKKELESLLSRLESHWRKGEILLRLNDYDRAISLVQTVAGADAHTRNRLNHVHLRALYQKNQDEAAQTLYRQMAESADKDLAGRLFRDIEAIASEREREQFENQAREQAADFFHQFWMSRHPVPTEEVNPRIGEHYRRIGKALQEYALQSTGRGYFVDREEFVKFSPTLNYYNSVQIFESASSSNLWVDHRGWILILHGEPDRKIGPRTFGASDLNETWMISGYRTVPMLFNFVRRTGVGEYTLALNLGVAATSLSSPDDPAQVVNLLTRDYLDLYRSRIRFHSVYRNVADARSQLDLERALEGESAQIAAFVKGASTSDSTAYFTKDNTLPLLVSVADYFTEGKAAFRLDFAVDTSVLDQRKIKQDAAFHTTLLLYDRQWKNLVKKQKQTFPLLPLPEKKSKDSKVLVGSIDIRDVDPEEYRVVLQIYQPEAGRYGIARGSHDTLYVSPNHLGISDLYLRHSLAEVHSGQEQSTWIPAPSRVIRKNSDRRVEFQLYNLQADDSGSVRYEVEEKLLQLYEKPNFWDYLRNYGNVAGQVFFPLYTFVAQVGSFTLQQALANDMDNIELLTRVEEKPAESTINEEIEMDLSGLDPGVYTVYLTIRDRVSNETSSEFLTFMIS